MVKSTEVFIHVQKGIGRNTFHFLLLINFSHVSYKNRFSFNIYIIHICTTKHIIHMNTFIQILYKMCNKEYKIYTFTYNLSI